MNTLLIELIAACAAVVIGLKLSDVDLAPLPIWRHRSAWTHGPLIALGVWYAAQHFPQWQWAYLALLVAVAIHLLADAFPRKWKGSAHINLYPLAWSLNGVLSFVYLIGSVMACGWVAVRIIQF